MAGIPALQPIPVSLLTGFLGAGKTTLLNRLLADPVLADTAVIVNELGAVGIDHHLVETATNGMIELSGGCLCCSVRGDLADTLAGLVDRVQTRRATPLKRVAIETTGLADPVPVLALFVGHPVLRQFYRLDGVVTVVDAPNGAANLARFAEARRQAAVADRIVLTKTDLAPATRELCAALSALNPGAPVLDAEAGEAGTAALLGLGPFDPAAKTDAVRHWLAVGETHAGHAHAAGRIGATVLRAGRPMARPALAAFLDRLAASQGERILRVKGLVSTLEDTAHPLVVQGVRGFVHPATRLAGWPDGLSRETRIVVIGEGIDATALIDLFAAFAGEPRFDAPDRMALDANPLAVPNWSGG